MRLFTLLAAIASPVAMTVLTATAPVAAADDSIYQEFAPAPVTTSIPGCSGTARANVRGQSALPANAYAGMDAASYTFSEITVWFDRDTSGGTNSSGSMLPCALSSTVTLHNLDTGATKTETLTVQPTGFRAGGASMNLVGPGHIEATVSTNPDPATIVIFVPDPN
ncbi:hypothetical protein GPX89_05580 [Nocardia sp. ET3-3]|uniref:Secreted protein n=1 Tax=Nocardia terrae TaxID=2675851 RepID=A0A7K1UQU3_9NOCA|nr:hypothetical protein [Nocardia terrae]MVU76716.1 hypothetical protein [Nocardia terrae]